MGVPKREIRIGCIILSVWYNEAIVKGKPEMIPTIVLRRIYRTSDGWRSTYCFGEKDLINIKKLISLYKKEDNIK